MRLLALTVLLCVLTAACGRPRFDAPEPLEVEPSNAEVGHPVEVVIRGRQFLPRVEADYRDRVGSQVDGTFRAFLGEAALEDVTFVSTTELRGRVPAGLALGRYELVVVDPSGAEGRLAEAFEVRAPPAVRLELAPARTVTAGKCSEPMWLQALDAEGRPGWLEEPVEVVLGVAPTEAVSVFADPACLQRIGSVRLEGSTSSQAVYVSGSTPVTATLSGTPTWLNPVEQQVSVVPGPVAQLVWSQLPPLQRAGIAFDVQVKAVDALGNLTDNNVNAALTAPPDVPLRCLTGCNPAGRVQFDKGVFNGSVAVDAAARGLRLTLTAGNLTASSEAFDVWYPEAAALAFTTSEQAIATRACSAPVIVELRDAEGQRTFAYERLALGLEQAPAGRLALFTDAACTTPLGSAALEPGESQLTFHFSSETAGAVDLTATSPGLESAGQRHQVISGSAARFAFDAVPSPQRRGADIPVRVRALDGTGALMTSFTGSAVLSLSPASVPLMCSSRCTSGTVTENFVGGVWTGTVRVGTPLGSGRVLTATSGDISGSSAAFTLVDSPRTPPRARLLRQPAVVRVGQAVTLNASGSTDAESSVGLMVSFDLEGRASTPPPWSEWGPIGTTTSHTFTTPGLYRPRIAVRDPDGDVGYATADVLVIDALTPLCVVTDNSSTDHGVSSCDDPNLSLTEALRIANAAGGREVITFQPGLSVAFTQSQPLTVSGDLDIIAPPGVSITGPRWSFSSGTVLVSSLTLEGGGTSASFGNVTGGSVRFSDVLVRDSGALELDGGQTLIEGSRFESCDVACVVIDDGAGDVRVRHSVFHAPLQNGINVHDCRGGVREIVSSTFHDLNKGLHVKANCGTGPVSVVNNTFHRVGSAASYDSGQGHVLVNNLIASASSGPIQGCSVSFARRSHNLLWSSDPDGCTAADPGVLQGDPMFIDTASGDYRLRAASPARDSGLDTSADVTAGAPGNFLGLAPDRGGRETW